MDDLVGREGWRVDGWAPSSSVSPRLAALEISSRGY